MSLHWCSNSISSSDPGSILSVWFPCSRLSHSSRQLLRLPQHAHFRHENKEREAEPKVCTPRLSQLWKPPPFPLHPILTCTRVCSHESRDSVTKEEGRMGFREALPVSATVRKRFSIFSSKHFEKGEERCQEGNRKVKKWVQFDYFSCVKII